MKKVLIISPYFPPANAADMQRIRMSLPYFKDFGWEPTVMKVQQKYIEIAEDPLLLQSLPEDARIIEVAAFSATWTRKFGLGAIGLRSLPYYFQTVNRLLSKEKFDLIYFSTTQFPVTILGNYWKKRFGIPYIIDLQDPWISDYYENRPKKELPKKYRVAKYIGKLLEPIAMRRCSGLIAVSEKYIQETLQRHPHLRTFPTQVITFGAFAKDIGIAQQNKNTCPSILKKLNADEIAIGYIGRGGHDMRDALKILFTAFKKGLENKPEYFSSIRFYFLGTSYAPHGQGIKTIEPLALEMGIGEYVKEQTDRIPFYQTLNTLADFDALFICGSNDPRYTASKIYPYIQLQKPLLSIFHEQSSASKIIKKTNAGEVIHFSDQWTEQLDNVLKFLEGQNRCSLVNHNAFEKYSAKEMTKKQVELFNEIK
jgi:hypothetical protein